MIHYVLLVFSVCCLQFDIELTAPRGFLKKNQSTKFGLGALISIKLALNSYQEENLIHYVLLVISVWCLQFDIQLIAPRGFLKKKIQSTKFGLRALISIKLALNSCQGENLINYVLLVISVWCLQLDFQLPAPRVFLKNYKALNFIFGH